MDDRTEKTLLLDAIERLNTITVQQATIQGSVNILLSNQGRADEDRRDIKEQVSKINGRIRALESAKDQAAGALGAARAAWLVLAGLVGFVASWLAKKLGLG